MCARMIIGAAMLALLLPGGPAAHAQLVPNLGGQRAGISALQFLKLGVGARGAAMGESFVAVADDPTALHWNPAGLVLFEENGAFFSHTAYLVDIRHDYVGGVYHLGSSDAVGLSISALHTDDMEITTETQPFGTGSYFTFGDIALGLSYARLMTDQFSFGVTIRYVEETLDVLKMRALTFDLGTMYRTGLGSLRFAVVISNFGGDVSPSGELNRNGQTVSSFQSYSVPTVFKLGVAFEPVEEEEHRLTTGLELNHPNDNSETLRLGVEYAWSSTLFLRAGVKRTIGQPLFGEDETSAENASFGAGVRLPVAGSTASADYAYSSYFRLGGVHRITLGLTF